MNYTDNTEFANLILLKINRLLLINGVPFHNLSKSIYYNAVKTNGCTLSFATYFDKL